MASPILGYRSQVKRYLLRLFYFVEKSDYSKALEVSHQLYDELVRYRISRNKSHGNLREHFMDINQAIKREKQIKGWRREKKDNLISEFNVQWNFLDNEI